MLLRRTMTHPESMTSASSGQPASTPGASRGRFGRSLTRLAQSLLGIVFLSLSSLSIAQSALPTGDERILAAREALQKGDRDLLDALDAASSTHILERYVDYWRLHNVLARAEAPDAREIEGFLGRYPGTVLAERLRAAWLERLAKDDNWIGFIGAWGGLESPDDDMRCLHWLARLKIGDRGGLDDALKEWTTLSWRADHCDAVLGLLAQQGRLDTDALWQRFRAQMAPRKARGAEQTLGWLPAGQMPDPAELKLILKDPDRYLSKLRPGFERSRTGRELALGAIGRLARSDPKTAYMRFVRVADRFEPKERAYGYVLLGWRGAQDHLPQALDWYRAAGRKAEMTEEQREWYARAALRQRNWRMVSTAILSMPEVQRSQSVWTYWLARAEQALGDPASATALLERIAPGPDYYQLLAQDELGHPFVPPAPAKPIPAQVMGDAQTDPDLRRALALFRLDLYTEGVREWNWRLRKADPVFKLAAARVALKHEVFDRAINTAEVASKDGEYELRFLTPYRDLIEPQARAQGLDLAWVYGLMRQESRFVHHAASRSGAQGLMQVMPATGKWVARKIGMSDYSRSKLADPETNVLLGTSYMRIVLDDLEDHPVLASAGYNAGPGRAKRWRDSRTIDAAIYIETIPFDETRHYVKQVMENAVVYAAMMEGKPQSIKSRLGVIDPG